MRVYNGYTAKIVFNVIENQLDKLQEEVSLKSSMQAYLTKEGFPATEMNELREALAKVEQVLGELHMAVVMHEDTKTAEASK